MGKGMGTHLEKNENSALIKGRTIRADDCKKKVFLWTMATALLAGVCTVLVFIFRQDNDSQNQLNPETLSAAMRTDSIVDHLQRFEEIAAAVPASGSRAVGSGGYNASAEYVMSRLADHPAYFDLTNQTFDTPLYSELAAPTLSESTNGLSFVYGSDFTGVQFSGNTPAGGLAAAVALLPLDGDLGCSAASWAAAAGVAVLVPRGGCTFWQKVVLATDANASAILFENYEAESAPTPIAALGPGPADYVATPMVSVTWTAGAEIRATVATNGAAAVLLTTSGEVSTYTTYNVVAQMRTATKPETDGTVIVVGAHLDSVAEGPGINDNGSGSAVILEMALQFAVLGVDAVNPVRFAWWSAEELGLRGSRAYIEALTEEELGQIGCNLNFDMLGSPNFIRGVYDGASANVPPNSYGEKVANGSATIQQRFEARFDELGLAQTLSGFDGRSDYGPFIEAGVPAGGLFTGAEGIKTPEERGAFGGLANAQYDPCYHLSCDTLANVDTGVLGEMAAVAAYVLQGLAMQEDLLAFLEGNQ